MKRGQITVAFVLLALGLMLAIQYRTTRGPQPNIPETRAQEISNRLKEVTDERDYLKKDVQDLRDRLDQAGRSGDARSRAIQGELDKTRVLAGMTPVRGQGVEVTLNDSPKKLKPGENPNLYLLHEEDLLKVINELRSGGAEAISINGQRLLATSEIRCAGTTILVNTKKVVPPLVILATGDPAALQSSLEIKGGIVETMRIWGLIVDVKRRPDITVPAFSGSVRLEYTKPVQRG